MPKNYIIKKTKKFLIKKRKITNSKIDFHSWREKELNKWMRENIIKYPPANIIKIISILIDWTKMEGSFLLESDVYKPSVQLGIGVTGSGYLYPYVSSINPPYELFIPVSYESIEFEDKTFVAIESAIRGLLPRFSGYGLHPITKEFIHSQTSFEDRAIDKEEFHHAKALINSENFYIKVLIDRS